MFSELKDVSHQNFEGIKEAQSTSYCILHSFLLGWRQVLLHLNGVKGMQQGTRGHLIVDSYEAMIQILLKHSLFELNIRHFQGLVKVIAMNF